MKSEDRQIPAPEGHWQAMPGLIGGLAGLTALVVAIGAGLLADNTATTVLLRGVVAMGVFWIVGYGAGWTVNRAVHADSRSDHAEDSGELRKTDDSFQIEDSVAEAQEDREAA
ncbi:MAG: hypothetical protein CMJ40_06685 [Phycisphaerae bacterium]|nr:hypothetical protein [Phycisphaerae bacterium]|tara:strand:+ start:1033 stop:1371 length:339 start_codon:yes stop_codon:yes gene_type:complete